eukprot:jgi/Botrbrau1/16284/Bobra.0066s0061.2
MIFKLSLTLMLLGLSHAYVENIHDLVDLKDSELVQIYNNPYGDAAKIPGEDRPGEYVHCVGIPLINAMSNYSDTVPSVMPYGQINPFTRWYGNWWNGKIIQTDRRGKTRGWNLLYTNGSVGLTTDISKANHSISGDPHPVVVLNYTNTDEIWARAFLDEMRQVGPNRYLGRTYLAYVVSGLRRKDLDPIQDAAQTAMERQVTEMFHAVLRARNLTGPGTDYPDQNAPYPFIFFALDCNFNATRMARTSYSSAMRVLNGPFGYTVPADVLDQQPLNNGEPQWIP